MPQVRFGKLVGEGSERFCYENLDNPNTCLKISKSGTCLQTLREVRYFRFLQKKGIAPDFIPKFYGTYTIGDQVVMEMEYFRSNDDVQAIDLREFITKAYEKDFPEIERALDKVKAEMIRTNVIVSDIRTGNIMLLLNKDKSVYRLVFIDGFGSPEFIPLPIYCPFFGRRKIERQWEKFMKKYQTEKAARLKQIRVNEELQIPGAL